MTFYSDKSWVGILSYSFIIFFLRTEGLSGLNLFLDNNSHLVFMIFQTSFMAIKSRKLTCQ